MSDSIKYNSNSNEFEKIDIDKQQQLINNYLETLKSIIEKQKDWKEVIILFTSISIIFIALIILFVATNFNFLIAHSMFLSIADLTVVISSILAIILAYTNRKLEQKRSSLFDEIANVFQLLKLSNYKNSSKLKESEKISSNNLVEKIEKEIKSTSNLFEKPYRSELKNILAKFNDNFYIKINFILITILFISQLF